jgi:hypothetical protein
MLRNMAFQKEDLLLSLEERVGGTYSVVVRLKEFISVTGSVTEVSILL